LPSAPSGMTYSGDNPYVNYSLVSPDGVLYEDNFLQIGFESHFHKQSGRLTLYYGNFSGQPITNITTNINTFNSLQLSASLPPSTIEPKKQEQQTIDVVCHGEIPDSPTMQFNYLIGGRPFTQQLRLPMVVNKFIQPVRLTDKEFLQNWAQLSAEKQQVVDTGSPASVPYVVQLFTEGFHLSVIPNEGTSWSNNNIVGAGLFTCSTGNHLCLVRVEVSATTFLYRTTIRSPSPILTSSLITLMSIILGKTATI